ncbi:MAG: rhodanese-like domain-containing protein [Actinobacteria bacterium]|nr:rhodanese-like domain-containing protein [Actinomycetota bacterium]
MTTPAPAPENEKNSHAFPEAIGELLHEILSRRALSVLGSTPLEEGEYIAHGLWGHELAAKLADEERDEDIYLLDVRSREAFEQGHIEGAHHVEFSQWASRENLELLPRKHKIIVICETGLAAAQVVAGLRLLGYDAAVPRTGMSGWTQTHMTESLVEEFQSAKYPVKRVPPTDGYAPAPKDAIFHAPEDHEYELIAERIHEVFSQMPTVQSSIDDGSAHIHPAHIITARELNAILQDELAREGIFLLDLRREEDFEGVGHIEGALRMDFDAVAVPGNLELLPKDRRIVTICYTGNLAAQLAAVLRFLGYDAAALAYGMISWTRTPTTYLYLKDIQKADNPLV